MTNKLESFIELIREGVEFQNPSKEDGSFFVKLYEDTLSAKGFSKEDIERFLKKLRDDGLVETQQILYAPKTTLSTYDPNAEVSAKAVPNEIYNQPVYCLHINEQKLSTPIPDEPFSFDVETGFLHFGGKKSKLPLNSITYYVLKTLCGYPVQKKITENDIAIGVDTLSDAHESSSRVYDARRRINKQAAKELGIDELIGYENATYWINKV